LRRKPQNVLLFFCGWRVLALQGDGVLEQIQLDLRDVIAVETRGYKIEWLYAEQVLDLKGPISCLL
jgi:hypothetical protein